MSAQLARQMDQLVFDLFERSFKSRFLNWSGWALALSIHAGLAGLAVRHHAVTKERERPPLDIEFVAPPPEAAPVVPPPPEPKAPEREPEVKTMPLAQAQRSAPAAAPAARAAALHTAKDDGKTPDSDDPLDFTHDPNVVGFGAGVVRVGGTAAVSTSAGPAAAPKVAPVAGTGVGSGDALTAAQDLGRKPSLDESDPCRGYFPRDALDDMATAAVMVVIARNGSVTKANVVSESPRSQGFGAAARACMLSKHFSPALDRDGKPTATAIRVNVRFSR